MDTVFELWNDFFDSTGLHQEHTLSVLTYAVPVVITSLVLATTITVLRRNKR